MWGANHAVCISAPVTASSTRLASCCCSGGTKLKGCMGGSSSSGGGGAVEGARAVAGSAPSGSGRRCREMLRPDRWPERSCVCGDKARQGRDNEVGE